METYFLWGTHVGGAAHTASFFATQVNIQRIRHGTREMIAAMLSGLGLRDQAFGEWRMNRFITNYLTDDPDSDDWEDSWSETWEVVVQLLPPYPPPRTDPQPYGTFEHDATWDGSWDDAFPVDCVVVADFDTDEACELASALVADIAAGRADAGEADEIAEVKEELSRIEGRRALLGVRRREGYPRQLLISLGPVDEGFFTDGAVLAVRVAELCASLGATTTWDDRAGSLDEENEGDED